MNKKAKWWLFILSICLIIIASIFVLNKQKDDLATPVEETVKVKVEQPKYLVLLDAGHGGYDDGCVSFSHLLEKDVNLAITLRAGEILKAHGVDVIYTRDSDIVTWKEDNIDDLLTRSKIANESGADLFVSIHGNSNDDPAIKGYEIWYSDHNKGSQSFAETMAIFFDDTAYSENRGVRNDRIAPLSVLFYNKIPSILIETGFLTNAQDEKFLISKEGQEKVASLIAKGVLAQLQKQ